MGAVESGIRQHTPLLPEPTVAGRSSGKAQQKPRNGPAVGTLLGAGAGALNPKASRKMEINLPEVDLRAHRKSFDSDGSTTAGTTERNTDDAEGYYPEAWNTPAPSSPLPIHEVRVVILDWDDTLLPTSFLRDAVKIYPAYRQMPSTRRPVLRAADRKCRTAGNATAALGGGFPCQSALETHAELVREMLRAARSMAHVGIVTLAERPWVHESAEQYLPSLNLPKLLEELDIPVYYAVEHRPASARAAEDVPAAVSKRLAMEAYLHTLSCDTSSTRLNVLSVGDSWAEREAAKVALQSFERKASAANLPLPSCKTIKLQTDPSLKMLTLEVRAMLSRLSRLIARNQGMDIIVDQTDSADDFEDKLACAMLPTGICS